MTLISCVKPEQAVQEVEILGDVKLGETALQTVSVMY